jgi:gliding motility-associated-like protein
MDFVIYDRWGEKVFETTDLSTGWDGKLDGKVMNPAVFVYYLTGTMFNGDALKMQGNITLFK